MATGDNQGTSTRPYLLRALHDWCTDNGFTPYVAVHVGPTVQVPEDALPCSTMPLSSKARTRAAALSLFESFTGLLVFMSFSVALTWIPSHGWPIRSTTFYASTVDSPAPAIARSALVTVSKIALHAPDL